MEKGLYSENLKTLREEIEDYTNRWKDRLCSFIGKKSYIVKMIILTMAMYGFSANPIRIPMAFFTDIEQIIFFVFLPFLGLLLWHMESPRLRV